MHRLLLRLYPASFRNEYGEELRRVFQRRRRDTSGLGVVALWLEEIADTAITATRVHMDILRQDLRHTRRSLLHSRGFALAAIAVTALGVGATTAAFTVADFVLLRPLPFADPSRVVKIWQSTPEYARMDVSPANFRDWRRMTSSFADMGIFTEGLTGNLVGTGAPVRLNGSIVTANLFPMLGLAPERGRQILESEDRPDAACVVLISDALWKGKFGGVDDISGLPIRLNDEPCTVVGVMPASVQLPQRGTDFWIASRFDESAYGDRTNTYLRVLARLKPGVTREQARADVQSAAAQLAKTYKENASVGATLIDLRDEVGQLSRMSLYILLGASACVLLIACTNLASLLIARSSARAREIAVRSALGAGRERLVRQMMTESLVLAVLGGAAGIALAIGIIPLIVKLVPTQLPISEMPGIDARMLLIAASMTVATGIGFGVFPALRASRMASQLRDGSRAGVSRSTERLRGALVVAQVAVSVVLLVGAGLLVRALWQVQETNPGFQTPRVLTMRTTLPMPKYGPTATRVALYQRVMAEVNALPGVTGSAYTSWLPMTFRGGIWPVFLPGKSKDAADAPTASVRFVTSGYFKVMHVPLKVGRVFEDRDTLNAENTTVVSESFVKAHWPGQDPIGKTFSLARLDRKVVGVVGDVRVRGLERQSEPQVYFSYQQQPDNTMTFYTPKDLVIGLVDEEKAASVTAAAREIFAKADPELPVADVRPLSVIVDGESASRTAQVSVLIGFAVVACLLAVVGLHGLLSFVVLSRTREIGVRLALGAEPMQVLVLILRQGMTLVAIGVVVGAVLSIAAGRSMEAMLAGVRPGDPATLVLAVFVSIAGAVLGTLLPAFRASRIAPTEALRAE